MDNQNIYPFGISYKEAEDYTKKFAKSFYFSSKLLPKEKRKAAYSIYAFCRYADNLIDLSRIKSSKYISSQIKKLKKDLENSFNNITDPNKCSLTKTIIKYNIPKDYFITLLDGVCMDMKIKRYKNIKELDDYCYKVASVVGLIMSEVFGYSNRAAHCYAITLGKAMQMTNILRDIDEDYQLGRIYIPEEIMKEFDYTEDDIANKKINNNFIEMMKYLILHTKSLYKIAEYGIRYLTNDGSRTTVVLMMKIYSRILDKIEKNKFDVYSKRNYVSNLEKVKISAKYVLNPVEKNRLAKLKEEFIYIKEDNK